MLTTTEANPEAGTIRRRVPIGGVIAVAAIWFAGMAIAAIAVRPDTVVAFGSPAEMTAAVTGSDGYLLASGRFFVAARTGPSTVRNLYVAGAWLVWPAIGKGCERR
jgi:hypothetical protein